MGSMLTVRLQRMYKDVVPVWNEQIRETRSGG